MIENLVTNIKKIEEPYEEKFMEMVKAMTKMQDEINKLTGKNEESPLQKILYSDLAECLRFQPEPCLNLIRQNPNNKPNVRLHSRHPTQTNKYSQNSGNTSTNPSTRTSAEPCSASSSPAKENTT